MNPFLFTRFRVNLFLVLLLWPVAALMLGFVPVVGNLARFVLFLGLFLFQWLLAGPARLFPSFFRFHEFGPAPVTIGGYIIEAAAYIAVVFIISWLGNLKKDSLT